MIEKLSQEQWDKLPEFVDKWVGYASEPINYDRLKSAVNRMYKLIDKKEPQILIANNPYEAVVTAIALQCIKKVDFGNILHSTLDSTLGNTLDSTINSTLDSTLDSTLGNTLDSTINSTLDSTLDSTLGSTLDSTLDNKEEIKKYYNIVYQCSYVTQYWSFWAGYYDYADFIGVKFDKEKLDLFRDFIREVVYCLAFENIFIVSQKPKKIHWKELPAEKGKPKNRILHNELGQSIELAGEGLEFYHLNNIPMKKEHILTPAEKMNPKLALDEKNTDVQRELIRKIGYERILKTCNAKTLEEWSCHKTNLKYKVQEMKVGNINRRYLCYEHASIPGVFYAKCMPPEAKSIIQMRAFQTGVFGFEPDKARVNLRNSKLTDDELLAELPENVQ